MKHKLKPTSLIARRFAWALIAVMGLVSPIAADGNEPPSFQGANRPFTLLTPTVPAPALPIYTLQGGVTTLKRFSGKVALVNIWATWCPACLHEMPTLAKLQSQMGGATFSVVALSIDAGGASVVSKYLKQNGLDNLPTYLDPAARILTALKLGNALPISLILDHQGRVMGYMKGAADWSSPDAAALIKYYIKRISP